MATRVIRFDLLSLSPPQALGCAHVVASVELVVQELQLRHFTAQLELAAPCLTTRKYVKLTLAIVEHGDAWSDFSPFLLICFQITKGEVSLVWLI